MERNDAVVGISLHGFEKRRFVLVQTRAEVLLAWAVSQFHYTTVEVCTRAPSCNASACRNARQSYAGVPNLRLSGKVQSIIEKTLFLSLLPHPIEQEFGRGCSTKHLSQSSAR